MTMYTTLTTRRLIGFLCNLELQGFDGCLSVYADKAWAELPNGAIRSLPLAYRQEYGNRHEQPPRTTPLRILRFGESRLFDPSRRTDRPAMGKLSGRGECRFLHLLHP